MAKLELKLTDEKGNETVYQEDFVSGQRLLDFWDMQIKVEEDKKLTAKQIFEMKVDYVASLFRNENVTRDSLINGIAAWDLVDTLDDLITKAIGGDKVDPKDAELVQEMLDGSI